jgi:two-component system nitrate/nitrite response regulator NarL
MIRILLVNETRLVANVIASVLEDEPDIQVVGTATTAEEALAKAPEADLVLVSTGLPDNDALQVTHAIKEEDPEVKVLILGLTEARERVLHYVEAGAAGYVLKDDSVDEMLRRIRAAYQERAVVSPDIAAALIERLGELSELFAGVAGVGDCPDLTPREREILELIAQGLTNQEIADRLVIEVGTVKNHVHNILDKLNVSTRQEAAPYLAVLRDCEERRRGPRT